MNYKDISDSELLMLVYEENEDAKNMLFEKYKYIIDIILKKYESSVRRLLIDRKEIYSEALYGYSDAIKSYVESKDASLPTFITLCVNRRVLKYIRKINSKQNQFLNDSYSLDFVYDELGLTLVDIISDDSKYDPLNKITNKEDFEELYESIIAILSPFEREVFNYMFNGLTYLDIASILNKEPKQIDNSIQRIKAKVKDLIKM